MKSYVFRMVAAILFFVTLFPGCSSPPDAPEDLETLLGFLFEHMEDEDPEALALGLENLYLWFQDDAQLQSAREGFVINNLPASALEGLDDVQRSPEGLEGITVASKSPYCSKALAGLLTWEDFGSLLDNFSIYERIFQSDPSCFGNRECLLVRADSHTKSAWAGIIDMESRYSIQFRWVETQYGWMVLQRFWLKEGVDGDKFDVKMNSNYYIGVIMDDGAREVQSVHSSFIEAANGIVGEGGADIDGARESLSNAGSLRVHANWFNVDTGVIPFSDDELRNILISNQVNDAAKHDNWLEDLPEFDVCPAPAVSAEGEGQ